MKDLLKAYRLAWYGGRAKSQGMFSIFFFGLGILTDVLSGGESFVGLFYMVWAVAFLYQMIITVDLSTLVQSSPLKKKIMVDYTIFSVLPLMYLILGIVAILHYFIARNSGLEPQMIHCCNMILAGYSLMIGLIYFGIGFKKWIVGLLAFILLLVGLPLVKVFSLEDVIATMIEQQGFSYSYWLCVVLSFMCMTIGGAICYGISILLYKKPLSPVMFHGIIGKK
ncbi:MAG: hypothetical protein K6C69_06080 [Lachnospiraceae bacterium]|nr:hypothetical protein [Lachnospiraceae bacterium]